MQIGVYIDGYNLYYGGKRMFQNAPGSWKWLHPRELVQSALAAQLQYAAAEGWTPVVQAWNNAVVDRVVYCTARVDAAQNPSAYNDQDVYLKAIQAVTAVDYIEYGNYVARIKYAPLAVKSSTGQPQIVASNWPVMVKDNQGNKVPRRNLHRVLSTQRRKGDRRQRCVPPAN
ncbi:hypothetical protein ABDZ15_18150 [Mycobacterium canetti]|uniref:hypothetical protein n=1 Tax=Mycobacterium canetti TaxID=78331 RepID=UPI0032E49827